MLTKERAKELFERVLKWPEAKASEVILLYGSGREHLSFANLMEFVKTRIAGKPLQVVKSLYQLGYDNYLLRVGDDDQQGLGRVMLQQYIPLLVALLEHPHSSKIKQPLYHLLSRLPVCDAYLSRLKEGEFQELSQELKFYLTEPLIREVEDGRLPVRREVEMLAELPAEFGSLLRFEVNALQELFESLSNILAVNCGQAELALDSPLDPTAALTESKKKWFLAKYEPFLPDNCRTAIDGGQCLKVLIETIKGNLATPSDPKLSGLFTSLGKLVVVLFKGFRLDMEGHLDLLAAMVQAGNEMRSCGTVIAYHLAETLSGAFTAFARLVPLYCRGTSLPDEPSAIYDILSVIVGENKGDPAALLPLFQRTVDNLLAFEGPPEHAEPMGWAKLALSVAEKLEPVPKIDFELLFDKYLFSEGNLEVTEEACLAR